MINVNRWIFAVLIIISYVVDFGFTPVARAQESPPPIAGTAVYWIGGRVVYLTIYVPYETWTMIDRYHSMFVLVRTSPNTPRAIITPPDSTPFWIDTDMIDDRRISPGDVRFTIDAPGFPIIGGYPLEFEEHCFTQSIRGNGWSDGEIDWTTTLP